MEKSFAITLRVSTDEVDDIIDCAIDGGIGYWCPTCKFTSVAGDEPNTFTEQGDEKEPIAEHRLTDEGIRRALDIMVNDMPLRYAACFSGDPDYDVEDADVFLQLCLFGKVVYG